MYQMRAMNKNPKRKIIGRGIKQPNISKRDRLMLGKRKKQKGGFFGWKEIWS